MFILNDNVFFDGLGVRESVEIQKIDNTNSVNCHTITSGMHTNRSQKLETLSNENINKIE